MNKTYVFVLLCVFKFLISVVTFGNLKAYVLSSEPGRPLSLSEHSHIPILPPTFIRETKHIVGKCQLSPLLYYSMFMSTMNGKSNKLGFASWLLSLSGCGWGG